MVSYLIATDKCKSRNEFSCLINKSNNVMDYHYIITSISFILPLSINLIFFSSISSPFTINFSTPVDFPFGFFTFILYTLLLYSYLMLYSFQSAGITGFIDSVSFDIFSPSIYSIPALYIQLLEPVYQVHPPLPIRFPTPYTSAAITYGSTLYRFTASFVLVCSIGFIILKYSSALSPNPNIPQAIMLHIAPCVYCPYHHFYTQFHLN